MGKMAFRMRSSKFRHVFGNPAKKENCYECIKITKNAHDSNFCAVNPKFVAIVTESAGGGAFLVLPLEKVGRVDINASRICGHSGPVLDIKWNPFNDNIIASCSDDATVKLWQIPEGGLTCNLTEWLVDLHGHQRRVGHVAWHPTAQSILLSAGFDYKCILWNTDTAEPINIIDVHQDTIFSIAWNYDGSMFATTSKDKKIRVIDPRAGEVIQEGPGHAGTKASKVVFLGDKNRLFSTGFSRMSDRQYAVWDYKNLGRPLAMENIDSSSGVLFPYYDPDTNVVFIAGKGDGNIRYFEIVNDPPYCHYLSQYQSSSPQRGLGTMPKRGVDPNRCEIVRFYKLHAVKGICEPVSMIVPRKSEMFQEDIFPPTASACPSLTADEWISGQDRQPILVSLKDGAISTSPVITTYKAVKRGLGAVTTTTTPERGMKRQSTAPPTATVAPSPGRLPASVQNIRKMTSLEDGDQENENEENMDNKLSNVNNNSVNDRISSFEKKTSVNVTKSVMRMTNNNQPLRVERKIWATNYTGVNTTQLSPTSNGVPKTDPELSFENGEPTNLNEEESESKPLKNRDRNIDSALREAEDELYAELLIENPLQKQASTRKFSRVSDSGSDLFSTPPTSPKIASPETPDKTPTKGAHHNLNENISGLDSPATWNENPLYRTSDTSVQKRKMTPAINGNSSPNSFSEIEKENVPELDDGIIRDSFYRRSLRSSRRNNRRYNSDITSLSSTGSTPKYGKGTIMHEENNNNSKPLTTSEADEGGFIDLEGGCFPTDAPDHSLIKPSKLRASLRGRKRPTINGSLSSMDTETKQRHTSLDSQNDQDQQNDNINHQYCQNQQARTPQTTSDNQPTNMKKTEKLENQLQKDEENNEIDISSGQPYFQPRNVIIVENKSRSRSSIASCTAKEKIPYPTAPVIPYGMSNPEPSQPCISKEKITLNLLPCVPLLVGSTVSTQPRNSRKIRKHHNSLDNSNSVHVRKVWSPEASPVFPPPDFGQIPDTDAELRKAYFRQVEEISSLKEQIGLKDKRIRQLEEEVRVLRDGKELMGESQC